MDTMILLVLMILASIGFVPVFLDIAGSSVDAEKTQQEIFAHIERGFLRTDGLVESSPNRTTSESQSYMMLMSVMSDRKDIFDSVWGWTKTNLRSGRNDALFSWIWENGKIADINSASDADADIALALLYAAIVWDDLRYRDEAGHIIDDIWKKETKETAGIRYLVAGDWAMLDPNYTIINPSYLAPYAYRIFSMVDPEHEWGSVVNSSYRALALCTSREGIPRNWCRLDSQGEIQEKSQIPSFDSDFFSYDAFRVPYRIALDYALFGDDRAYAYLSGEKAFSRDWGRRRKVFAIYDLHGMPFVAYESMAFYGSLLARLAVTDSITANRLYREKIEPAKFSELDFFHLSWLWFGLNFYGESKKEFKFSEITKWEL